MILFLYIGLLCITIIHGLPERKIGGGWNANNEFPYHVSLQRHGEHNCGGTILNKNYILTAAHCLVVIPKEELIILTGTYTLSQGGKIYRAEKYLIHPFYDNTNLKSDVGLVRVKTPIIFNNRTQAVNLETYVPKCGTEATVIGWGYTNILSKTVPDHLQQINTHILSMIICKIVIFWGSADNSQICTINTLFDGIYPGDSGSPLLVDGKQIGIVSWGYKYTLGFPFVYTKISYYYDWIVQNSK